MVYVTLRVDTEDIEMSSEEGRWHWDMSLRPLMFRSIYTEE